MGAARWFIVLGLLGPLLIAQQVGDPNRDYAINGWGFGLPSDSRAPVIPTPGIMLNQYETLDANAPVAWLRSTAIQVGWILTPMNSVDLDPAALELLADGRQPGFIGGIFRTGATGSFEVSIPVTSVVAGGWYAYVMAHFASSSPEGFWVSQAVWCQFLDCSSSGQIIPAGDDTTHQVTLLSPLTFYGVVYSSVYVNSNGNLTFGQGSTAFDETVPGFLSGPPRIAPFWDDFNLDPLATIGGGTLTITESGNGIGTQAILQACWQDVPEYGSTSSTNTFMARFFEPLQPGALRILGLYYGGMTALDGLVGVSPGNNLDPVGTILDLSGPTTAIPGGAAFEIFGPPFNPNDLEADNVLIDFDANGFPTSLIEY